MVQSGRTLAECGQAVSVLQYSLYELLRERLYLITKIFHAYCNSQTIGAYEENINSLSSFLPNPKLLREPGTRVRCTSFQNFSF